MISLYAVLWVALFALIAIYFFIFGLSHLYDYRVGQRGVEFVLLRYFRAFTINYGSIESAREMKIFTAVDNRPSSIFTSLVIGNRIALGLIVLKMRVGPFRYVALTPANREAFLKELSRHLPLDSQNKF
jgi:hypothetical protein